MAKRPTVLLIEPDHLFREALEPLLNEAGFQTRVASDTDEALNAVGDAIPDALVVAWELPEGHCMKLLKRILTRGEFEGALVIYDCPKVRAAEDKLEEWIDGELEYAVLEAPADADGVLESLMELLD